MTYLDHDPVVKKLKEKDLYVTKDYLGKGGIKSWELVMWPSCLNQTRCSHIVWHRWRKPKISSTVS